jgi:trk system potassium uptake protein TrkA
VNNPKNIKIFEKLGVDSAVSSTSFIVDIIEKEVFISGLRSLTTIGNISINEIKIHSGFSAEDRQIKELQLPKECIIISIIRNNELIIPGGSTILRKDDELIIVLKRGDEKKLEKVFGKY